MLRMLVADYNLVNVCFDGFVSPAGLPTYYRKSDLFASASLHEGYCLPVVEAMHHDLPVVALETGGVPEALGSAGILYADLKPVEVAALWHRAIHDTPLRSTVLDAGRRRMDSLRTRNYSDELRALVAALAG